MTTYKCPSCGWTGDHINQTDEQVRIDHEGNSYSVALCPECADDVEVEEVDCE